MIASAQEVLDAAVGSEIPVDGLEPVNSRPNFRALGEREDKLGVRERRDLVVFVKNSDFDLGFCCERRRLSAV